MPKILFSVPQLLQLDKILNCNSNNMQRDWSKMFGRQSTKGQTILSKADVIMIFVSLGSSCVRSSLSSLTYFRTAMSS